MPARPSLTTAIWSATSGKRSTTRPSDSFGPELPPPSRPWQLAQRSEKIGAPSISSGSPSSA
jgi:hypothetical protein